jgi:hypothetical protein
VSGETWRHLPIAPGESCADCGRCDVGLDGHAHHVCHLSPAWFAGSQTVCQGCFAHRIRVELRALDVDLVGISERVARGDSAAIDQLRGVLGDAEG